MLPLSHIFISTSVAKKKTPLLVFGSVFPDISWTSKSEIGRDQIHYAPREFYKFISENYPKLVDLALGVKLHSNTDKGADFYSDDTEHGFAKIEGRKIEADVAKLLGEKEGEKTIGTAHSFIEASVDILLNKNNPSLLPLYRDSIKGIDLSKISLVLSAYLKLSKESILFELQSFLRLVGPEAYSTEKDLIDRLILLLSQRRGKQVNSDDAEKILGKSIKIMSDRYQDYLSNAIENMRVDFADQI